MSSTDEDEPLVPVVCSDCETRTRVPIEDVAETVERHNDRLHDGESIAEVDPVIADRIADLVAADLGLYEDEE